MKRIRKSAFAAVLAVFMLVGLAAPVQAAWGDDAAGDSSSSWGDNSNSGWGDNSNSGWGDNSDSGWGSDASSGGFTDVDKDYWAYNIITWAVEQGLFLGTSDTTFEPEDHLSRGMFALVLSRLAGVQVDDSQDSGFSDVPVNDWYCGAVAWAAEAGVMDETSDGAFSPDADISREEMAVSLAALADSLGAALPDVKDAEAFADEASVSAQALDAVQRCRQAGILLGDENGFFHPQDSLTRAETAAIMISFRVYLLTARGIELSAYAADWSFTPANSFELVAMISSGWGAATPSPTGKYNDTGIYGLENIPYVTNPTISNGTPVQMMNIYVPEEYMVQNDDGTCSVNASGSKTVTYYDEAGNETGTYTWTAETAPIVFINTVNGYAGSTRFSIEDNFSNIFFADYISKGFIIVGVDSRGIGNPWGGATTMNDDGLIVGKAPAGLVDLKAAVAFLKYNDAVLAGDSEKIVSQGYSAGGAMSALLGATGDAPEYDSYLKELGAAGASNSVYASQVYCPIADLDNGDAAFEWLHRYQTSLVDWSGNAASFTDYQMALHEAFAQYYVEYIQSLGFDLGDDGESGTYYTELTQKVVDALNHAVDTGTYAGGTMTPEEVIASIASKGSRLDDYLKENNLKVEDVLSWNEAEHTFVLDSFKIFDLGGTFERAKSVPSIDGSIESGLFGPNGVAEDASVHFSSSYLAVLEKLMESDNAEIAAQAKADYDAYAQEITDVIDSGITHLMNPMYYMTGEGASTMAKYWRFQNGTADPDLGSAAAWTMYNQMRSLDGYVAEFSLIHGAPHGSADYLTSDGAYQTPNALMTWIAQAAAGEAVSD